MRSKHFLLSLQKAFGNIFLMKNHRLSPQEAENEAFRASMRGQFLLLKEMGLPIQVSTL